MVRQASDVVPGHLLKQVRILRGEPLEAVAERTRISVRYLQALEEDAPVEEFPSPMYARLFLRTYARYLDLEEERLVRAFSTRHGVEASPSPGIPPAHSPSRPGRAHGGHVRDGHEAGLVTPRKQSMRTRSRIKRVIRRSGKLLPGKRARRRSTGLVAGGAALALVLVSGSVMAYAMLHHRAPSTPRTHRAVPSSLLPDGTRTLLPGHRVVAFYGLGRAGTLGVLGAGPPPLQARRLVEQMDAYDVGDVRLMPAFELIATSASRTPGDDHQYRHRDSPGVVQGYLDAIRKVHGILIVDVQPGRSDFFTEVEQYESFLREPDVGLALDGEWHVGGGQVPGVDAGTIDAATVNRVSAWLSAMVERDHLPQKLLLVHQFTAQEVIGRGAIRTDRPGLATVLDVDGYGTAEVKSLTYQQLNKGLGKGFFHGLKLYYRQDTNLMNPLSVMGLRPTPDVIIYQ